MLPLAALIIRAPWSSLGTALTGSAAAQALVLSLWTASVATAISLVIGVPLAWALARGSFPGTAAASRPDHPAAGTPARGGRGRATAGVRAHRLIGRYLDSWFGLTIPFSPVAVVMAETFVAMPFLVITVEGRPFSRSGLRGSGGDPGRDG
jgi:molybdate transport system permease protein